MGCKHFFERGFCTKCGAKGRRDVSIYPGPIKIEILTNQKDKKAGVALQVLEDLGLLGDSHSIQRKLEDLAGAQREVLLECEELAEDGSRKIHCTYRYRTAGGEEETITSRPMGEKYDLVATPKGRVDGSKGIDWLARLGLCLKPLSTGNSWLGPHAQVCQIVRLGLREGYQAEGGIISIMPDTNGMVWTITDGDGYEIPAPGYTSWWVREGERDAT